jgi:hypothetical protein
MAKSSVVASPKGVTLMVRMKKGRNERRDGGWKVERVEGKGTNNAWMIMGW